MNWYWMVRFKWWWCIPLRGRHQSSIYPDKGDEWQERTKFVIFIFHFVSNVIKLRNSIDFLILKNKEEQKKFLHAAIKWWNENGLCCENVITFCQNYGKNKSMAWIRFCDGIFFFCSVSYFVLLNGSRCVFQKLSTIFFYLQLESIEINVLKLLC